MDDTRSSFDELTAKALWVVLLIFAFIWLIEKWPEMHRRAARYRAYQRRGQWRKADIRNLKRLGVHISTPRLQRIENSKRSGRGVVTRYHAPDVILRAGIAHFNAICASATKPKARLVHLKKIPFLLNCVIEALYRGEHIARKASGQKAPSARAEEAVAYGLGVSSATVHKRCTAARREWQGASPEIPALTLFQFEKWLQVGGLIWPETEGASVA
jgi:hypothetical protein